MASYFDLSYINDNIVLCACKNYLLISNIDNVENSKIINPESCLLISIVRYPNWIKAFTNFLSQETFTDECLVNKESNFLFKKENRNLKVEIDKNKTIFCFTKLDVKKILYEFSFLFVHCLSLPDDTKLCFFELLLNFESILEASNEGEKIIKNFTKKDFIDQFRNTITTFQLNVSAVHIYICLYRFKKEFLRLSKMRRINDA